MAFDTVIQIRVKKATAQAERLRTPKTRLRRATDLFERLAEETILQHFRLEAGTTDGKVLSAWKPLAEETVEDRLRLNFSADPILQRTGAYAAALTDGRSEIEAEGESASVASPKLSLGASVRRFPTGSMVYRPNVTGQRAKLAAHEGGRATGWGGQRIPVRPALRVTSDERAAIRKQVIAELLRD